MISYEGTVKVVDFGVAKAAHRDTETRSGTVKGKITYMSPEQCKGLDIDRLRVNRPTSVDLGLDTGCHVAAGLIDAYAGAFGVLAD